MPTAGNSSAMETPTGITGACRCCGISNVECAQTAGLMMQEERARALLRHAESRDGGLVEKNLKMLPREDALLRQIRAEYLEMPGLCLTCAQAQRLFGLDPPTCFRLLASLTKDRFLYRRANGSYGRLSGCTRDSAVAGDFSAPIAVGFRA